MNQFRAGESVSGITCTTSLNTDGTQTIIFKTLSSSTVIPTNISQVIIGETLEEVVDTFTFDFDIHDVKYDVKGEQ